MIPEKPHQSFITVRGYELDSYGHVNNAVYLQYMEQGRWSFMKDMDLLERIELEHLNLVVTETRIRYMHEANIFDELLVETTLRVEKPYLVFRQRITNQKTAIVLSRATIQTIFVNRHRMAVDIPGFIQLFVSDAERASRV